MVQRREWRRHPVREGQFWLSIVSRRKWRRVMKGRFMRISRDRMGSRKILDSEPDALAVFISGCIEVIEFFLGVQSYFLAFAIDI